MDRKYCRYCARMLGENKKCPTKECPSKILKGKRKLALYCSECGRILIDKKCKNKECISNTIMIAAVKNIVTEKIFATKQMKKSKKRNKVVFLLSFLVATAAISGGTFLYLNSNTNKMNLTSDSGIIAENNKEISVALKTTGSTKKDTSTAFLTTTTAKVTTAPPKTTTAATTTTEVVDLGSTNMINGGYVWYDGIEYRIADNFYSTITIGEKLYYEDATTHHIYCCDRKNLSDKVLIYDGADVDELTYYGEWFYFRRTLGDHVSICKMRTDGSDVRVLVQCDEWYMNVYQDKIYFINFDKNHALQCMDLNGDQLTTLATNASDICVVNDTIFFSNRETRYLYKMNLDGTNLVQLNHNYTRCTNYYQGNLYYFGDDNHMIYRCDLMGNIEKSYEDGANFLVLAGGYIYAYMDNAQIRKIACD